MPNVNVSSHFIFYISILAFDILILTFDQYTEIKEPNQLKKMISDKLDLKKSSIIKLLENDAKNNSIDITSSIITIVFYLFLGFILLIFIKLRFK